jgi:hypothetical protein
MDGRMSNARSPAAAGKPDASFDLEISERLFIWGLRATVRRYKNGKPAIAEVQRALGEYGVEAAAPSLDALVQAFALTAHTPIEVHCTCCPCVSSGEWSLLKAAAAAQQDDLETARRELERWLPGVAADWVLAPMCGLGGLFQAAGLRLPLREAEAIIPSTRGAIGSRLVH